MENSRYSYVSLWVEESNFVLYPSEFSKFIEANERFSGNTKSFNSERIEQSDHGENAYFRGEHRKIDNKNRRLMEQNFDYDDSNRNRRKRELDSDIGGRRKRRRNSPQDEAGQGRLETDGYRSMESEQSEQKTSLSFSTNQAEESDANDEIPNHSPLVRSKEQEPLDAEIAQLLSLQQSYLTMTIPKYHPPTPPSVVRPIFHFATASANDLSDYTAAWLVEKSIIDLQILQADQRAAKNEFNTTTNLVQYEKTNDTAKESSRNGSSTDEQRSLGLSSEAAESSKSERTFLSDEHEEEDEIKPNVTRETNAAFSRDEHEKENETKRISFLSGAGDEEPPSENYGRKDEGMSENSHDQIVSSLEGSRKHEALPAKIDEILIKHYQAGSSSSDDEAEESSSELKSEDITDKEEKQISNGHQVPKIVNFRGRIEPNQTNRNRPRSPRTTYRKEFFKYRQFLTTVFNTNRQPLKPRKLQQLSSLIGIPASNLASKFQRDANKQVKKLNHDHRRVFNQMKLRDDYFACNQRPNEEQLGHLCKLTRKTSRSIEDLRQWFTDKRQEARNLLPLKASFSCL